MPQERSSPKQAVLRVLETEDTPALVIDRGMIRQKYREFCHEFPGWHIYYALKANPHPGIVEVLRELGCDFEISSQGELDLLLRLGVPAERIISSNPVKAPAFIRSARDAGIDVFAFDSSAEVDKLSRLAPGSKVYVRLSVPNEGSEWPLSKKFGVETEEAVDFLVQAQDSGLAPQGIAFHVGSQCTNPSTWAKAIGKSRAVWDMAASRGVELCALNIGGGFPVEYTRPVPSVGEIARVVREAIGQTFPQGVDVLVAPGRALVGEAGVLAATVLAKADRDGEKWLYLDVGVFNGLMEAVGGMKYALSAPRGGQNERWVLAGPSCDSFDVISTEAELPELEIGDRLYIKSAGAYTTAYASEFDGFPIPKVHFVE
ncbi:MAG: type III PLP-dependent enzyme [Chloroflexi bacterium]|nr:MAG: type III PLP-dependent enzyme [Chloroflexota bacterium]